MALYKCCIIIIIIIKILDKLKKLTNLQSKLLYTKLEGTHRVQTHAILLLTLTFTFQPKIIPLVGYLKVIPYTKFEHFLVMLWTLV